MPNPPLLPGLETSWIYLDWTGYTQAELRADRIARKLVASAKRKT